MEGAGIWIFLLLFYLLQAITKRKQKQQRQQSKTQSPKPSPVGTSTRTSSQPQKGQAPQKPQQPVSLEDIFNPDKLRDILGVPQPKPAEKSKPTPQPSTVRPKSKQQMRERWQESIKSKQSPESEQDVRKNWSDSQTKEEYYEPEVREKKSTVASADITDVDESATDFRLGRLGRSDITSDRFDHRKTAPGKKKKKLALEYFDEAEDIRNAIVLKEILDRPRAFRRNIR